MQLLEEYCMKEIIIDGLKTFIISEFINKFIDHTPEELESYYEENDLPRTLNIFTE